jgi:hypothetical protein
VDVTKGQRKVQHQRDQREQGTPPNMITKPRHWRSPGRSANSQCYPTRQSDQSKVRQPPSLASDSVSVLQIRCSPSAAQSRWLRLEQNLDHCAREVAAKAVFLLADLEAWVSGVLLTAAAKWQSSQSPRGRPVILTNEEAP